MTMTPMTLLEATNLVLQAVDEPPVASLLLPGLLPLERAKAKLTETSRLVQSTGWSFNTEAKYPLSRASDGTITLPGNALRLDIDDEHLAYVDPVLRGLRLYDRKAHSYTFTRDLTGTLILALEWDELPQPARHYIALHAAVALQGPQSVSQEVRDAFAAEKQSAWLALQHLEADEADPNALRDSTSVLNTLEGGGW